MADPKYAALPGIAFDQPDVYESEDVIYNDQDDVINQDQSDSVEKLSTNIKDSFSKFEGHWLDSSKTDFSGKIGLKHHTGYSSWNGPYELQALGEKESPIQKLNRLKCEVADLEEELALNKEVKHSDGELYNPEALATQVRILHKQLMAIKIEETVGISGSESLNAQEQTKKKCLSELQEILQTASALNQIASKAESPQIVYELQYKPHQVHFETATKAANLMNRIDRLESIFGTNQDKMNNLNAETGQKSLADAVKFLHSKVSLLDTSHIDQVEARLGVLIQKLNTISDKNSVIEEADKVSKVKEVYEFVKKLEPLMSVLPAVVDRLLSLKKLHEEAVNFGQSLTSIENVQSNLQLSLETQSQLLIDIQSGLVTSKNTMTEAVKQLDSQLARKK